MESLLDNDYNAKNFYQLYKEKKKINLPKGKLGIAIEKIQGVYVIVDILQKSILKNIVNIGDELYSFNDELLDNKSTDEIELLFFKNIISERIIVLFSLYL